jgi:hypothetical protein
MNHITVKGLSFIEQKDAFWISGVEICSKLNYVQPQTQAAKIWNRHKEILRQYSTTTKLVAIDGRSRSMRVYNESGARFFITKCNRPEADRITIDMIEAFIKLRDSQLEKDGYRNQGKIMHRNLTDQLQNTLTSEPDASKHWFLYMNVAKNNCKAVTGKMPKQIREERGSKTTRDAFTEEELVLTAALETYQAKHLERHPMNRKAAYLTIKDISQRLTKFFKGLEYID